MSIPTKEDGTPDFERIEKIIFDDGEKGERRIDLLKEIYTHALDKAEREIYLYCNGCGSGTSQIMALKDKIND